MSSQGFGDGISGLAVEEFGDSNLAGGSVGERDSRAGLESTWTFHWLRRRMGRAAEGCWAVTAVNCWRASCWAEVSCERSVSVLGLGLAMMGQYRLLVSQVDNYQSR